jgi:hypothetical protein
MLALLQSPENWIALAILTVLETVLGIDNIIFLSILVAAPAGEQPAQRPYRRPAAGDADAPGAAVLAWCG